MRSSLLRLDRLIQLDRVVVRERKVAREHAVQRHTWERIRSRISVRWTRTSYDARERPDVPRAHTAQRARQSPGQHRSLHTREEG